MLTDTKLRALKPRAKLYPVADANGLAIEVSTTGAKLWRYRYRYLGKASMAALGEYPAVPLADARAERDRLRALLQGGANPAHLLRAERETKAEHAANTFAALADEWLAKWAREGLSPGTFQQQRRLIGRDLAGIAGTAADPPLRQRDRPGAHRRVVRCAACLCRLTCDRGCLDAGAAGVRAPRRAAAGQVGG